jgi:hypothetical protein
MGLNFSSYDLELDKKLAEETTVLVESYTVRFSPFVLNKPHEQTASRRSSNQSWIRTLRST